LARLLVAAQLPESSAGVLMRAAQCSPAPSFGVRQGATAGDGGRSCARHGAIETTAADHHERPHAQRRCRFNASAARLDRRGRLVGDVA
jgi:hypothetical protein